MILKIYVVKLYNKDGGIVKSEDDTYPMFDQHCLLDQ
jgi:hypothetical protein